LTLSLALSLALSLIWTRVLKVFVTEFLSMVVALMKTLY
jgi:hypothetical protein